MAKRGGYGGMGMMPGNMNLSLIHISEPTRRTPISYAVFCLKKKKNKTSRRHKKKQYMISKTKI